MCIQHAYFSLHQIYATSNHCACATTQRLHLPCQKMTAQQHQNTLQRQPCYLQGRVCHELVPRAILGMEVHRAAREAKEDAVAGVGVGDVDCRVLQQLLHILQVAIDV